MFYTSNIKNQQFNKQFFIKEFNLELEQIYLDKIINNNSIVSDLANANIKGFVEFKIIYYLTSKIKSVKYNNLNLEYILPTFYKLSKLFNCSSNYIKKIIQKYISKGLFILENNNSKYKYKHQQNNNILKINLNSELWNSKNQLLVFEKLDLFMYKTKNFAKLVISKQNDIKTRHYYNNDEFQLDFAITNSFNNTTKKYENKIEFDFENNKDDWVTFED